MKWPLLDVPGSAGLKDSRSPTPGHLVSAGFKTRLFTAVGVSARSAQLFLGFRSRTERRGLSHVAAAWIPSAACPHPPQAHRFMMEAEIWILSHRRELVITVSLRLHNVGP